MFRTIPRAPLILGLAGLLPFRRGALTAPARGPGLWIGRANGPRFAGPRVMLFYGAVIVSFMSGARRGLAPAWWIPLRVLLTKVVPAGLAIGVLA